MNIEEALKEYTEAHDKWVALSTKYRLAGSPGAPMIHDLKEAGEEMEDCWQQYMDAIDESMEDDEEDSNEPDWEYVAQDRAELNGWRAEQAYERYVDRVRWGD